MKKIINYMIVLYFTISHCASCVGTSQMSLSKKLFCQIVDDYLYEYIKQKGEKPEALCVVEKKDEIIIFDNLLSNYQIKGNNDIKGIYKGYRITVRIKNNELKRDILNEIQIQENETWLSGAYYTIYDGGMTIKYNIQNKTKEITDEKTGKITKKRIKK